MREIALVELQKRIGDGEGRLKQQQALYEAVRADRNMYSKSLIEAQVTGPCTNCRWWRRHVDVNCASVYVCVRAWRMYR
jgi:hypothetical protein